MGNTHSREARSAQASIYEISPGESTTQSQNIALNREKSVSENHLDSGHLPARGFNEHRRQAWAATKRGWAKWQKWHDKKNHAQPGCNGFRCRLIRKRELQAPIIAEQWRTGYAERQEFLARNKARGGLRGFLRV